MTWLPQPKSCLDLLHHSSDYLENQGVQDSRLTAERLLGHVLGVPRSALYIETDLELSGPTVTRFKTALARRAAHEPLQYILGETEFMSLPFTVNHGVLIPRPETEILVEAVERRCQARAGNRRDFTLLDLGTGSGCIAVSLAHYFPKAKVTALDISSEALAVARENAVRNNVATRIEFVNCDLFSELCDANLGHFDVLVSNPPYISEGQFGELAAEIKDHEPKIALSDMADGLTFYRRTAILGRQHLNDGGLLAIEFGMGQGQRIQQILKTNGFNNIELLNDLNGIPRVALGTHQKNRQV